jgi:hypothetical protein
MREDEELRAKIIKENSLELDSIMAAICYNTTSRTSTGNREQPRAGQHHGSHLLQHNITDHHR